MPKALRHLTREGRVRSIRRSLMVLALLVVFGAAGWFLLVRTSDGSPSESDAGSTASSAVVAKPRAKNEIQATVTSVLSGDSIVVSGADGREFRIQLTGIEAVAGDENARRQATENLANMILGKEVFVTLTDGGNGGIYTGRVVYGETDIGSEQVRAGFATERRNIGKVNEEEYAVSTPVRSEPDSSQEYDRPTDPPAGRPGPLTAHTSLPLRAFSSSDSPGAVKGGTNPTISEIRTASSDAPPPKAVPTEKAGSPVDKEVPRFSHPGPPTDTKMLDASARILARCTDGAVVRRATRSGACAGHGGVATWLEGTPDVGRAVGRQKYVLGPRGGCYYLTASGSKSYVDRSLCKSAGP